VIPMLHACLFPSSLKSLKARYLKKLSCCSKLGLPGTQKTTNDEDNMGIRGWKAVVPKNTVELNSEIQECYKV
jgi:hypothetical protein